MAPPVPFSVNFTLVSADGLRKVDFALEKTLSPDGSVEWSSRLSVNEKNKTSDSFVELTTIAVNLEELDHAKAEETARRGLNAEQVAAVWEAATSAKQLVEGKTPQPKAERDVRRVIKVRKF